jgi:multisubunit Na+/H+ antiporter MnhE subunit
MTNASPEATTEPGPSLLLAVLVLAFTVFNAEGHWTPIDTVIGAVVSVILVVYTHTALRKGSWPQAIAISLAYASAFT